MKTMTRIYEALVQPASGGFGMWQVAADGPELTDYESLDDFESYMDSYAEVSWRWADEISGSIYNQNGGRPFAWQNHGEPDANKWSYGLLYVEEILGDISPTQAKEGLG
jgi:hypothetical protein